MHVGNDEVRVAPPGGVHRHFKIGALSKLLDDKQITIEYTPFEREGVCLRAMSDAQIAMLHRRRHYVLGMYRLQPDSPCSQTAIKRNIHSLSAEINDQDPPSPSTIANWIKRWRDAGSDDTGLVNRNKPSRVEFRNIDRKVLDFVSQAIESVYLNSHRLPKTAVMAEIQRLIANHYASSGEELVVPSNYIVNQMIGKIDLFEKDAKRKGKAFAARKHSACGRGLVASSVLDIVFADGQKMDAVVVDVPKDGGPPIPLGRPFLTTLIDLRTRCILAAYVSLQPFCGGTALKALSQAVVQAKGKPRGIMRTLVVDNGCDYQDSGFMRFVSKLDIRLEICGPRMPNGKAQIERFFRTINEDLVHKIPGSTFSNTVQRGEYRSQDLARFTLAELRQHVDTWIHEIYHTRIHRTLGRAPIDVWNEETQA